MKRDRNDLVPKNATKSFFIQVVMSDCLHISFHQSYQHLPIHGYLNMLAVPPTPSAYFT